MILAEKKVQSKISHDKTSFSFEGRLGLGLRLE